MYNNISWDSVSGYLTYTMDEAQGYGSFIAGKWFIAYGERVSGKEKEMGFNLDDLGNYGTTFIGPYAMTMWPEGGGTIGWEGNITISSDANVDLRGITTTDNLILLKETVDGTTQHVYSSASADDIFLSKGTTMVSATYGDFIEGVVGGLSLLSFSQMRTSAATVVLAETDQITTVTFEDGGSLTMRNVNHVLLNSADDSYAEGNSLSNHFLSFSNDNVLRGGGGDDTLTEYGNYGWSWGDDGNDTLSIFGRYCYAWGGEGDDSLFSEGDDAVLLGENGNDNITSIGNYAVLDGGNGDDVLVTYGDETTARGGYGNDKITSFGFHEALRGGIGDDLLISYGLEGRLVGDRGFDTYKAYGDKAQIFGSATDGEVASFAHFGDGVTVAIFLAQVSEKDFLSKGVQADIFFDTGQTLTQEYFGFNDVIGTGGDDMIGGNDQNNILDGGGGLDIIEGHGGDDTITVERIGDIDGGDGWDTLLITGDDGSVISGLHGLHNIEALDIEGDYTMVLDNFDIVRTTDNRNTLRLEGDSNDSLFLHRSAAIYWYNFDGFNVYTGNNSILWVDEDIDVTFIGRPPMEQHP